MTVLNGKVLNLSSYIFINSQCCIKPIFLILGSHTSVDFHNLLGYGNPIDYELSLFTRDKMEPNRFQMSKEIFKLLFGNQDNFDFVEPSVNYLPAPLWIYLMQIVIQLLFSCLLESLSVFS